LRNTLIAGEGPQPNLFADSGGTFVSQGYNLSSDDGGGFLTGAGDLTNTDPRLGPLQDNGGPTQTHALLPGSPALNAGDPSQLGTTDQRGVVRSGGVNIGAYQASASAFLVRAPDAVQSGVPFGVTVTAVDPFNQTAVGYTGTVTFSTTDPDPGVVLPAAYTFTTADAGTHPFSATLNTAGTQTITATETATATITGAQSGITVSPAMSLILTAGQSISSPNGQYQLIMQSDGNLVEYGPGGQVLWNAMTDGNPGAYATMRADGNFVVYSAAGTALWNSHTDGNPGAFLVLNDGGALEIVDQGTVIWMV
jgi:hypothetical protein